MVFKGLSGFHIDDCVCTVMTPGKEAGGNAVIGWVVRCAPALCNAGSNVVVVRRKETIGGVWGFEVQM